MCLESLLPDAAAFQLGKTEYQVDLVSVHLRFTQSVARCTKCQQPARRVHSHYMRTVADVPLAGVAVRWQLTVRRFFCDNAECPQLTFTEQVPSILARGAHRSRRLADTQTEIGFALGGEAGTRLSVTLGMTTSADTLLRLIRRAPEPEQTIPHVLGVDDWARRKGQTYGTILIDLEQSRPIELLPDREADTLAQWLQAHPGVEMVTRDRAAAYVDGITRGAPDAVQVADRWHLLENQRDAIERMLDRHQSALRQVKSPLSPSTTCTPNQSENQATSTDPVALSVSEQRRQQKRARRLARYQAVKALQRQGVSQRQIAKQLHLSRKTVSRYLHADEFPERAPRLAAPNPLIPYMPYLQQRWNEGCHNARQLWRELCAREYTGGYTRVWHWTAAQRRLSLSQPPNASDVTAVSTPKPRAISARQAGWLLVKPTGKLTADETSLLQQLKAVCPAAKVTHDLAQQFGAMIRERTAEHLDSWLTSAMTSGITELRNFATSLTRDWSAVRAALTLPWSNGPTEGHVHRLKLIKRQMYGRAKFDLLRKRVLYAY